MHLNVLINAFDFCLPTVSLLLKPWNQTINIYRLDLCNRYRLQALRHVPLDLIPQIAAKGNNNQKELDTLKELVGRYVADIKQNSRFQHFLATHRFKVKTYTFNSLEISSNKNISDAVFDYCCHPKSGDDIVAFKMGTSAIIHHKFCSHANKLMRENTPMYFVGWHSDKPNSYKLIVSIENKKGSLAYFLQYLAKIDVDLVTISLKEHENTQARFFELVVDVSDKNREKLLNKDNSSYRIIEFAPLNDAYKK